MPIACVHVVYYTEPPYLPAIYQLSPKFLEDGMDQYDAALRDLRECVTKDKWPGFIKDSTIPVIEP